MWKLVSFGALLASGALLSPAPAANQILLRQLDIGESGHAWLLTAGTAGSFFTVSTIVADAGLSLLQIEKLDAKGDRTAVLHITITGQVRPSSAASDSGGNLVIAGRADAAGLPLVAPLFSSSASGDGFVLKVDTQLRAVLFATRFPGSPGGVAIDSADRIWLAGSTQAQDFPLTATAFQTKPPARDRFGSGALAFVTQISSAGDRVLYSTYFGGYQDNCGGGSACIGSFAGTGAQALTLDSSGAVTIVGTTTALDLPVTSGAISKSCSCLKSITGFAAKLLPGATPQLLWSTYINANPRVPYGWQVHILAVATDSAGNIVLAGDSTDPIVATAGVIQEQMPAAVRNTGFAMKLNSSGALVWATLFGGRASQASEGGGVKDVSLDRADNVLLAGLSDPARLPASLLFGDRYVARISSDGRTVQDLWAVPSVPSSAGRALVVGADGHFGALGANGGLWIEREGNGPSMLAIANAAGGLPSALVADHELISVYGFGIGPPLAREGEAEKGVYNTSLDGYQILYDGLPMPILYAGPTQINAVIPTPYFGPGRRQITLVTPAARVDGPQLARASAVPRLFKDAKTGFSLALNQDGSVNSPANPARPGAAVSVFASGCGSTFWQPGTVVPLDQFRSSPFSVAIISNDKSLEVLYAGDAPGLVAGVTQINFRLPATVPSTLLGFELRVGGAVTQGLIAVKP